MNVPFSRKKYESRFWTISSSAKRKSMRKNLIEELLKEPKIEEINLVDNDQNQPESKEAQK